MTDDNEPNLTNPNQEKNEKRRSRRPKQVDLEVILRKFKTIVERETHQLMDISDKYRLSKDDIKSLDTLVDLSIKIRSIEQDIMDGMTEEALRKAAKLSEKDDTPSETEDK